MNRIKELRLKKGIKQSELAALVNLKQNTISNWENEITEIDKQSLLILKDYFDVTTDYLLGISSDSTPPNKQKEPDPEWGSFEWLRKGLIARGTIKDGEDITDEQLSIAFQNLENLVKILMR